VAVPTAAVQMQQSLTLGSDPGPQMAAAAVPGASSPQMMDAPVSEGIQAAHVRPWADSHTSGHADGFSNCDAWSDSGFVEANDAVSAFCYKWGLNSGAMQWLNSLTETVRDTIISQFAPRCDPKDTHRMLYGFGRSIISRHGGGGGKGGSQAAVPTASNAAPQARESLESFVARFQLDGDAIAWLHSLDPNVLTTVIAEFNPQNCGPSDAVKMLYAFGRSVSLRHQAGAAMPTELRAFAQRWSLDAAGLNWLLGLPAAVQGVVVREFAPREGVVDAMTKLRAFARSVEQRSNPSNAPPSHHGGPSHSGPSLAERRANEFIAY